MTPDGGAQVAHIRAVAWQTHIRDLTGGTQSEIRLTKNTNTDKGTLKAHMQAVAGLTHLRHLTGCDPNGTELIMNTNPDSGTHGCRGLANSPSSSNRVAAKVGTQVCSQGQTLLYNAWQDDCRLPSMFTEWEPNMLAPNREPGNRNADDSHFVLRCVTNRLSRHQFAN